MALGETLKVKVSAATEGFEQNMEDAQEKLGDFRSSSISTSGALEVLTSRIRSTEDEMEELDDEAGQTSRSFLTLAASSNGLSVALGATSTAALGLATSLSVLSTALAPLAVVAGGVIAAIASLGAVFGGLALVGVITHFKELTAAFKEARKEILEIIEPLGEVFGPLLVDAVEALPELVQGIVDSLGPLEQFRETLIEMGEFAMEVIPAITGFIFDLAEDALPVLNNILDSVQSNTGQFERAVDQLRRVFNRVAPLVVDLGRALADLAPPLLRFGTTVAVVVLPALTDLVRLLTDALQVFNSLPREVRGASIAFVSLAGTLGTVVGLLTTGGVISGFTSLASAIGSAASAISGAGGLATALTALTGPVGIVIAALAALTAAFITDFANIRTTVVNAVKGQIGPLLEELGQTLQDIRGHMQTLKTALIDGWKAVDEFVMPVLKALTRLVAITLKNAIIGVSQSLQFFLNLLQGDFKEAVKNSKNLINLFLVDPFEAAVDAIKGAWRDLKHWLIGGSFIPELFSDIANYIRNRGADLLANAASAAAGAVEDAWNAATPNVNLNGGNGDVQFERIASPNFTTPNAVNTQGASPSGDIRQFQATKDVNVTVTVEDDEIVAKIDDRIERNDRQNAMQVSRLNGEPLRER